MLISVYLVWPLGVPSTILDNSITPIFEYVSWMKIQLFWKTGQDGWISNVFLILGRGTCSNGTKGCPSTTMTNHQANLWQEPIKGHIVHLCRNGWWKFDEIRTQVAKKWWNIDSISQLPWTALHESLHQHRHQRRQSLRSQPAQTDKVC